MILKFQKEGIVPVGTADETQIVNLLNPFGYPTNLTVNIVENSMVLTILAYDERNNVVREYPLQLDHDAKMAFLMFFAQHIRRIAKLSYPEFDGLIELAPEL